MNPISWIVLSLATIATGWLIFYVRVYLPHQAELRLNDSLKAFSKAIELRFPTHNGKTEAVLALSMEIARYLGLTRLQMLDLEMAARLRDIGLCAVPYGLVNGKAESDWTEAEKAIYDRHPDIGGSMLESVPSLGHLTDMVRYHHNVFEEYPMTADGKEIRPPIQADILCVASAYVWHERNYGELLARDQVISHSGTLYNPAVVKAFGAVLTSSRVEERKPSLVH